MKTKLSKRVLSLILCLALCMAYLPKIASAAGTGSDRTVDPSTMDGWKTHFLGDPLNTENAGSVWTDKSVLADDSSFSGTGIYRSGEDSFLVALSAMASNMTVTGLANVPTDTMMILDLSSSMYNGYDRNPSVIQTMLNAVNDSIGKLQRLNEHNRVGVVIYYGGQNRLQSNTSNSMVLLPLDRYSGTSTYLKANVTNNRLISVAVNAGVKNSSGAAVPQATRTVTDVAGTYAQLGILDAMDQLLGAATTVPTAANQPEVTRVPVMIFMSDGEPTAATHRFTEKVEAGMGNNTVHIRSADETDFVTQLTAAYAKERVDAHYVETEPLFYTLSLGSSVSLALMAPETNTTPTIDGYWTRLLSDGSVNITVYNSPDAWSAPTVKKTYTVSQTSVNGTPFPSGKAQRNYVNKAFTAANAGELTDAFGHIVSHISVVSKYTPTLTSGNADLSGYISFVDKIGQYMKVTDIKGVLIDNMLYSGVELAKNFVAGGGNLGTYDAPTPLGDEMVHAVQARLDIESVDAARTLIGLAYEHGQLSYTSPNEYSNYIGWYANATGQFLGFWHEGITTMPEATGDAATDPAFIIKSYGYLGAVDESYGVEASDMMYATVQIRENIVTGEQSVAFAVPAALIPIVTYEVTLDRQNQPSDLTVTGAEHPVRLIYEVALDEKINSFNLKEQVSAEYLAAHTDTSGAVSFYTNQFEADHSTGYGKVNAYSYFNPSRQNDRFYYLQDAPVYTDTQGTLYTGSTQPEGTYYRSYTVYEKDGTVLNTKTVYRRLSDEALSTAKQAQDGSWYIGAGNVHVNLDGYTVTKTHNTTGTMPDASIPFVDAHNHSVGDLGYNFIVGATLGNNGKVSIAPETGIALSKRMADGTQAPNRAFQFTLTNLDNDADAGTYPARLLHADGTRSTTTVDFVAGKATVALNAGETLYIGGMSAGTTYQVEEEAILEYIPLKDTVTVTLEQGKMTPVDFVNAERGTGSLTVSKEVIHPLGNDYQLPENRSFLMDVVLTGVGVANATFDATHTDGSVTSVTTDENGGFTVSLHHNEQLEIFGLPTGTIATVTERTPGAGFTPGYQEDGEPGDGKVTIPDRATASVVVVNRYQPDKVDRVNVVLHGRKNYTTSAGAWNGAVFEFQLQKWTGEGWNTIATASASETSPTFHFNEALRAESFTAPGTYYYQVMETHGGQTISGITYDGTLHTFGITVTDQDMDGKLEINKVTSFHTGRAFNMNDQGDWQIDIAFNNRYDATGTDLILDVQKALVNPSGSPLVDLSGYQFGLYDGETLVAASELTDGVGEARFLLHYDPADIGTHSYTLKEILPETPIPNMTYSTETYSVTVEVADNGDGTTSAAIVSINGDPAAETPVFTNTYDPDDAELSIDFVDKKLTGRDLVAGEFTFKLRGMERTLTGTNDAEGNVIFQDALVFDKVGSWYFDLVETTADGKGVTTDKTVYHISVTVTDENGQLVADHHVLNVVGDAVVFENTYAPKEISYTVTGKKVLNGRVLLNEEFTFVLTDGDGNPIAETKNFADGTFSFAPISFSHPGTYRYTVWERAHSSADFGIVYDTTVYQLTLTVIDNLEGSLVVSNVAVTGGKTENITFTNAYTPKPASAVIPGSKILHGKVLSSGDFRFELYQSDAGWTEGKLMETVTNGADGSFTFSEMEYDTAGTRYYLVKEVHGGFTYDGIMYDGTVYRVAVEVIDNLLGQLQTAVYIYDSQGIPRQEMAFVNIYTVVGEAEIRLEGTKTLLGRELVDGEFTFELYRADDNGVPYGQAIQTAVNADGKFHFDLSCSEYELGKTLRYVVKERNAGHTDWGVTYSSQQFHIAVAVEDNGTGGIQTTTTITKDGQSVPTMDFVNDYTADQVEVILDGTKTLHGRDLADGEFTFELYASNEDWAEGDLLQTVSNDTEGSFTFQPITFTTAGIRHYLLRETHAGKTLENVVYDDTVYRITVDVADDLKGQLNRTLDIRTHRGSEAQSVTFENTYIPDPQDVPVPIKVQKTVKNLGSQSMGPEGFEFLLENRTLGGTQTATSDANGQAAFTLTFTKADIGKTYAYRLTEVNGGNANVEYSKAVYDITVAITLSDENALIADITENGVETAEVVASFENIHRDPPPHIQRTPKTSDTDLTLWIAMLIISCGGVITLTTVGKSVLKKHEEE